MKHISEFKYGDIFSLKEFIQLCTSKYFIDYDGHGSPVNSDDYVEDLIIKPSIIDMNLLIIMIL